MGDFFILHLLYNYLLQHAYVTMAKRQPDTEFLLNKSKIKINSLLCRIHIFMEKLTKHSFKMMAGLSGSTWRKFSSQILSITSVYHN